MAANGKGNVGPIFRFFLNPQKPIHHTHPAGFVSHWLRSLEGLKKIALALHISLDELVFDPSERGPQGERLALLFEAVAGLPADEQRVVQAVLDGLIVKHRTRQLAELHT